MSDETAPLPKLVTKDDIASWRGGYPARCDWCDFPCPPEFLEPEESSMWVCHYCMWEWETVDIARALATIFGEPRYRYHQAPEEQR